MSCTGSLIISTEVASLSSTWSFFSGGVAGESLFWGELSTSLFWSSLRSGDEDPLHRELFFLDDFSLLCFPFFEDFLSLLWLLLDFFFSLLRLLFFEDLSLPLVRPLRDFWRCLLRLLLGDLLALLRQGDRCLSRLSLLFLEDLR